MVFTKFSRKHIAFSPLQTSSLRQLPRSHPVAIMLDNILHYNMGNILAGGIKLLEPTHGAWNRELGVNSLWAAARMKYV